ncbi:hypothetical protein [Sphingobacterium lactis]|uniref:hypothetical protein n=1 Tax=Sphingobacterium lactis TaxID=797291 RepID=UPI0011B01CCB|nr:hypothetical protein [Sphingobacterium lactis]
MKENPKDAKSFIEWNKKDEKNTFSSLLMFFLEYSTYLNSSTSLVSVNFLIFSIATRIVKKLAILISKKERVLVYPLIILKINPSSMIKAKNSKA